MDWLWIAAKNSIKENLPQRPPKIPFWSEKDCKCVGALAVLITRRKVDVKGRKKGNRKLSRSQHCFLLGRTLMKGLFWRHVKSWETRFDKCAEKLNFNLNLLFREFLFITWKSDRNSARKAGNFADRMLVHVVFRKWEMYFNFTFSKVRCVVAIFLEKFYIKFNFCQRFNWVEMCKHLCNIFFFKIKLFMNTKFH